MLKTAKAASKNNEVYQLNIMLDGIIPPIWRRLLVVPTMKLGKLHDLIQVAMGWSDYHLHLFDSDGTEYSRPYGEPLLPGQRNEVSVPLNRILSREGASISYEYDYGDSWIHTITLEKILPVDSTLKYPIVVAGERACPPEDSGGIGGYYTILQALRGEDVEDAQQILDWLPPGFDPEAFDLESINRKRIESPARQDWSQVMDPVFQVSQGTTKPEINEIHEEATAELARLGETSTQTYLATMNAVSSRRNRTPREAYGGLTPEIMATFLDAPFDCPQFVEFSTKLTSDPDSKIGLLFGLLAAAIGAEGVKATATGNLPRNLARDIVAQSMTAEEFEDMFHSGKIQSESDFPKLQVTRFVGQASGLIRKSKGRFLLTNLCRKLMSQDGLKQIYPRLLQAHATKYDWGFLYHWPIDPFIQPAFVFTLYLLDRFGDEWRPVSFYEDAFMQAFPRLLSRYVVSSYSTPEETFRHMYRYLCLDSFCVFLGLAEAQYTDTKFIKQLTAVRKTAMLNEAVRFHVPRDN